MNNKNKIIGVIICIVIIIIVISIVALIILKSQMKNVVDSEGNVPDKYGDYPDYGEMENQNNANTESEEVEDEETKQKLQENYYEVAKVSDQEMAEKYFVDYRDNRLYFPEEAYQSLEESYRNRKFGTIEKYKEYLDKNRTNIATSSMKKYKVSEEDGKKVYTCLDQNNNYYVFVESAIMQYTVREGKYNPEPNGFAEEYNNSIDETKAMKNVNRFIMMINNKEYDLAYKVLESEFRDNYFKTEEDFANYIKGNFYEDNNTEFTSINEEEGKYICKTCLINNADENSEKKEKTFEVILLEGTDFTISFDVEQKDNQ